VANSRDRCFNQTHHTCTLVLQVLKVRSQVHLRCSICTWVQAPCHTSSHHTTNTSNNFQDTTANLVLSLRMTPTMGTIITLTKCTHSTCNILCSNSHRVLDPELVLPTLPPINTISNPLRCPDHHHKTLSTALPAPLRLSILQHLPHRLKFQDLSPARHLPARTSQSHKRRARVS